MTRGNKRRKKAGSCVGFLKSSLSQKFSLRWLTLSFFPIPPRYRIVAEKLPFCAATLLLPQYERSSELKEVEGYSKLNPVLVSLFSPRLIIFPACAFKPAKFSLARSARGLRLFFLPTSSFLPSSLAQFLFFLPNAKVVLRVDRTPLTDAILPSIHFSEFLSFSFQL